MEDRVLLPTFGDGDPAMADDHRQAKGSDHGGAHGLDGEL
jgi:hypothetical protein